MQEAAVRAEADVEPEALQSAVATADWVGASTADEAGAYVAGDDGGGFVTPRPMTGMDSADAEDAEEHFPRETTECSSWLSVGAHHFVHVNCCLVYYRRAASFR